MDLYQDYFNYGPDIWYLVYLLDLYQYCSNYGPGVKNGPALGVTCFSYSYGGKIFLCETRRHRPLIFGMSLYQYHIFM